MPKKKVTPVAEEVIETPVEVVEEVAVEETKEVKEPKEKATKKADKAEKVEKSEKAENTPEQFYYGYGRRKTATARARLYLPTKEVEINGQKLSRGDIYVNNVPVDKYFTDPFVKANYTELFRTTNTAGRFVTTVIASGSGKSGQAGAMMLGIARALCEVDPKFKAVLRKKGYMTRDSRMRERKKPGLMGARKQKSSPKR